jgi:hypothetical protein
LWEVLQQSGDAAVSSRQLDELRQQGGLIEQAVQKLKGREWFWIDDEIETLAPAIQKAGISPDRCIRSNPLGQDELLVIQSTLAGRLERLRTSMGGATDNEEAA